jgi:hypothetical protein
MRRILAVVALAMTMCLAVSAQAAKYDEKSSDIFRVASFFHYEQIDFDAFLYVDMNVWHDNVTRLVKIDKSKYVSNTDELQFCYSLYIIDTEGYYPIDSYCGRAPISALSSFDATGLQFSSSGLDLSCARDTGPYIESSTQKSGEPKGLDRKVASSSKYWYNRNNCNLVAMGQFYFGTGQQVDGVYKSAIKDPTY